MRWPWQKIEKKEAASLDSVLANIAAMYETVSGISVTPDNCMRSPTVHAIVTAVQNRLSISPIEVMQRTVSNGRAAKKQLPDHPVARLMRKPNNWQTTDEYVGDAASSLIRHGRFFAVKGRGATGPILFLDPLEASSVEIAVDDGTRNHFFRYNGQQIYQPSQMHYARLGARDFLRGDSPVMDISESIALEIAAERHGAAFFGNGAMPLIYFQLMEGFSDFQTDEEKLSFLQGVKKAFSGNKKFSTMMLPKGMDLKSLAVENDKAQFIETRRFIRTVIAGGFGVPPHLVGDLERATYNNVFQQDTDFIINVVLPIARRIEAAMERDLLTQSDRNSGVIIRFNLDAVERADVKTRNESLRLAREWGAINVNEWREKIDLNPISKDDGGEDYIRPMNMAVAGEPIPQETDEGFQE
jgi:HK97 family phage portal protein